MNRRNALSAMLGTLPLMMGRGPAFDELAAETTGHIPIGRALWDANPLHYVVLIANRRLPDGRCLWSHSSVRLKRPAKAGEIVYLDEVIDFGEHVGWDGRMFVGLPQDYEIPPIVPGE